jgi:hypothetical protein
LSTFVWLNLRDLLTFYFLQNPKKRRSGAEQKGNSYLRKVTQEFHEHWQTPPSDL